MSKKDRKRRSMIAVILLIAFLITGCEDKSAKTDHIIRIGVVTYTQDVLFSDSIYQCYDGSVKRESEKNGNRSYENHHNGKKRR